MSLFIMLIVGFLVLSLVLRLVGGMLKIFLVVVILMLLAGGSFVVNTENSTTDSAATSI